ncbi:MAG TPA: AAA family ATPase [Polyangiaceae bacterium]
MLTEAVVALRRAVAEASRGLVDRAVLAEAVVLAAVAGEHVLVAGAPGTAKSEAVRRIALALGGKFFDYLLGRFTEPQEIFGAVDLQKLREGRVEVDTTGMLPEADVVFLDEVFLGSTAILNTLLSILNERTFRRGHTSVACPLRVCIGACNAIPDEPALAAFADRFLVRVFVEPVPDARLEEMLEASWTLRSSPAQRVASVAQLAAVASAARRVDLTAVRGDFARALRLLRAAQITLSDRRAARAQGLVAAAAVLDGRSVATRADLWPLVLVAPTADAQSAARDALRELLAESRSDALPTAVENASAGPAARAARLVAAAEALFAERPPDADAAGKEHWRLRLEAIAREIDAGFLAGAMPGPLEAARARIVAELSLAP